MYTSLLSVSGNASSQGKICSDEINSGKINIPPKMILMHSINNTSSSFTYYGLMAYQVFLGLSDCRK